MNLTVTYSSGVNAGNSSYVRVGHNTSVTNEDAVWSFTLSNPVSEVTFNFSWNNTSAGTGWRGKYNYAFALSSDGASGKQLAKGSNNIAKVTQALEGKTGVATVTFKTSLSGGTYYLRANFNGTKNQTMKAFSKVVSGSASGMEESGGGGVLARKIYMEKSTTKEEGDNTVDRLIMVGYGGMMLSSTNGTSWSSVNTGTTNAIYGVAFLGGKYIAVGDSGIVLVSSDSGATWTSQVITSAALEYIAYSDGLWAVCGGGEVWVSTDASAWELVLNETVSGWHFDGILWDGSKFIVYGDYDYQYVSNDGYIWTKVLSPLNGYVVKMIKAMGAIYRIRYSSTDGIIDRSFDGYKWENVRRRANGELTDIIYGNGKLVAVGDLGLISYSEDGVNWTDITWASATNWSTIGYGFGKFVVGGASTANTPYRGYSNDGVTWTGFTQVSNIPTDIAFGLSKYHNDIKQSCLEELQKRYIISKVEGEVENTLPPKYGEDYRLGDLIEVNAAKWLGVQRITKVRHVLEPNRVSITPVVGDDFLDLRHFISREVDK